MDAIHVTEAEQVLLEALWRLGPLTPQTLTGEVQQWREWSASTIKTLLARLIRKGAVGAERGDGRLRYRAMLDRETYVAAEVEALADRLFGGDQGKLAAWLNSRPPLRSGGA